MLRTRPLCLLATILTLTAAASAQAAGQAVTVQIGPSKDATLYESVSGSLANGAGDHLFTGLTLGNEKRRTLIAIWSSSTL